MDEFEKKMEAIYEYNRRQQSVKKKLSDIQSLVDAITAKPKLTELLSFLAKLRDVLQRIE